MYESSLFDFTDLHNNHNDDNKDKKLLNTNSYGEDTIQNICQQRCCCKHDCCNASSAGPKKYEETKLSEENVTELQTKILHSINKVTDAIYKLSNTNAEIILQNLDKFEKFFKILHNIHYVIKKDDAMQLNEMMRKFLDKIKKIR